MGFTALECEARTDVLSSLLLPLPGAPRAAGEPSIALVLYAARPGAFVDLAADAAWLTDRPLSSFVLDGHLARYRTGKATSTHCAARRWSTRPSEC
jgi:hypothetical protein